LDLFLGKNLMTTQLVPPSRERPRANGSMGAPDPYAHDINPDDLMWSYVKRTGLARNLLRGRKKLEIRIDGQLREMQKNLHLVRLFFCTPSVAYISDCSMTIGIKSAPEAYGRNEGTQNIDYKNPPEEVYIIYSRFFSSQEFFDSLSGIACMLTEFVFRMAPGRFAVLIAFIAANAIDTNLQLSK